MIDFHKAYRGKNCFMSASYFRDGKVQFYNEIKKGVTFQLLFLFDLDTNEIIFFPIWLQNRLISAGLELVLSHTENSYVASYYKQFSTNNKKNIRLIQIL